MTTINQLTQDTTAVASDQVPLYSTTNAATRRVSLQAISNFVLKNIESGNSGVMDFVSVGFFDYNDSATAVTPITLTTNNYSVLTNNAQGGFTNRGYPPFGVTDVWDKSTNTFTWANLALGDQIDIRVDCTITTTTPNQQVTIDLFLGQSPGSEYPINFVSERQYKSAGVHHIVAWNGIYMGDANTINNRAQFKIKSDASATVVVAGWYCRIIRRPV